MAQKRMLDKKISVSEQVADLPIEAQLIFTWSIPHADDIGLLPNSAKTLKALIVPMLDMPISKFTDHLNAIVSKGLLEVFTYEGQSYYRLKSFADHQTLKKDRQPQTILPLKLCPDHRKSWEMLEDIGFQVENAGIHMVPEEKRREEKRREEIQEGVANAPTPKEKAKDFFNTVLKGGDEFGSLKEVIATNTGAPLEFLHKELLKFTSYWLELNPSGKKQRWELQKTFEVNRRLATWLSRAGPNRNSPKSRAIISTS
jgi:hypothetical protein